MTRRTLQAVRHVAIEDLGSFEAPLRQAAYDIEYVDAADRSTERLDTLGAGLLVVLGGPIGVQDQIAYPVVSAEIRLLPARLAAVLDVPVFHWHGEPRRRRPALASFAEDFVPTPMPSLLRSARAGRTASQKIR